MKICPKCSQTFGDETLNFCLMDGTVLEAMSASSSFSEARTAIISPPVPTTPYQGQQTHAYDAGSPGFGQTVPKKRRTWLWALGIFGGLTFLAVVGLIAIFAIGYAYRTDREDTRKTSATPVPSPAWTPVDEDADIPDIPDFPGMPDFGKGEYDVTLDKFNQLKIGQPRSEVEAILGGKGTEISSSKGGGMNFSVNQWEGNNFKSIIISFKNDKIMTKSQVGLK